MERARRELGVRSPHAGNQPARGDFGPGTIRFVPNLYIAQTQPGFEGVAWSEIAARLGGAGSVGALRSAPVQAPPQDAARGVPRKGGGVAAAVPHAAGEFAPAHGARELARRIVPDRAAMTIFKAPRPDQLLRIRTAEDVFAVVGYRRGLDPSPAALERVRAAVHDAPYIANALEARVRMLPGSKAGQRMRFRVIARMAGDHEFRRVDFKHVIERGMTERGDRTWRLDEKSADVEFWATLLGDEFILAIRLNDDRMRQREYKVAQMPGSLRPAAAAALAWLSAPAAGDVVLDPMCGAGTILIERAHMGRYQLLIGGDRDAQAIADARTNVGPRYRPIEFHPWDATALPLGDASVDKVVTNLPWGIKHGTHEDNRRLYPRLVREFTRVTRRGGAIVMLTAETHLMRMMIARGILMPEQILRVSILGAPAAIYVCRV